jgi:hypothetical protein
MNLTKENVHDGKILKELVHNVSKNNKYSKSIGR